MAFQWRNVLNPQYDNTNPVDAYVELVRLLGPPTSLDKDRNGQAIWNIDTLREQGNSILQRVELHDELVVHDTPNIIPHYDFVYTYIKLRVPEDRIEQVLKVSPTITYDALKGWICSRCTSLATNYAALLLCAYIARGEYNMPEIKHDDAYVDYFSRTFPSAKSYDPSAITEYATILLDLVDDDED